MKTRHYFQLGLALLMAMLTSAAFASGLPELGATLLLLAPAGVASLEELATEFATKSSEFKTITGEVRAMQQELLAKTAGNDATLKNIKESVDEWLTKFNAMRADVDGMEQKLASRVKEEKAELTTWGQQFVAGNAYKAAQALGGSIGDSRTLVSAQVKQVTSAAAGGLIRSQREAEVVSLVRERRVVRDLLRTVPINTSSVDYATQTGRTNNAAPVAESAAKPYSDYTWGTATATVRTLAHLAKITRQAMDDAPRLIGEIDSEMRYGLGFVEERQFLYGTGVGQNLHGIIPQATAFAVPAGFPVITNASRVDVLRIAMLQASLALLPADGIVLNLMDWGAIELTKTTDGAYLFANPQGTVGDRMWGLPVVSTPAMDAGDFLVGAFGMGATVYDRMGVEVLISTENADDFEKNLATMRAEERVAIAVKRPAAFVTGDFTAALADVAA